MAAKPRSEWTEAYRRRVERAEAAGKTRQAARGHREKEHVIRKAKEAERKIVRRELTSPEKQVLRRFSREQAPRLEESAPDVYAQLVKIANTHGYEKVKIEIDMVRSVAKQYRHEAKRGLYASRGMGFIDALTERGIFPGHAWYYYH